LGRSRWRVLHVRRPPLRRGDRVPSGRCPPLNNRDPCPRQRFPLPGSVPARHMFTLTNRMTSARWPGIVFQQVTASTTLQIVFTNGNGSYILCVHRFAGCLGNRRREREPGAKPGLPRSGERERPPSDALVRMRTGKRRPVGKRPFRPFGPQARRPAGEPRRPWRGLTTRTFAGR
jgi:hypothetical protein